MLTRTPISAVLFIASWCIWDARSCWCKVCVYMIVLSAAAGTPRATPYMVHQKRVVTVEEYSDHEDTKQQSVMANQPRGINRLSSKREGGGRQCFIQYPAVVADLLQNESVTTIVQKRKEKQGEDSGLESGHTSMNTGTYIWTRGPLTSDLWPLTRLQPQTRSQIATLEGRTRVTPRTLWGPASRPGAQTLVSVI